MGQTGQEKKKPLTLDEAEKLENWSERIFAIAVCSIPHLEVIHEPQRIGNPQGVTVPDFLIRNKKRGKHASDIYIEVTGAKDLNGKRKQKQNRVMKYKAARENGTRYFQLPRKTLEKISCAKKIEIRLSVCRKLKNEKAEIR